MLEEGPVTAGITSGAPGFLGYKSGIFSCQRPYTNAMFDHAIEIVGYNNVEGYYIIKNSWGTGWGMDGYAKISMVDDCWLLR